MRLLMSGLVAMFMAMPVVFADHHEACSCDEKCKTACEKGGNKECKCSCGCAKTGKCKHGKCSHHHDHKKDEPKAEEKK